MKVRWSELAHSCLVEIYEYIAANDPEAADQMIDRLVERGDSLSEQAERGRRVPEVDVEELRELIVGNYRLVYRLRGGEVTILMIFEGHMLLRHGDLPDD